MKLPIDRSRQKVYCEVIEEGNPKLGRTVWLFAVDAREQIASGLVRLAAEAPPPIRKATFKYGGLALERLRAIAQDAGIPHIGVSKQQIVEALEQSDYAPPVDVLLGDDTPETEEVA